jgi:hypothetical protein
MVESRSYQAGHPEGAIVQFQRRRWQAARDGGESGRRVDQIVIG